MEKMNRKSLEGKMERPLLVVETQSYCSLASAGQSCKHCSVEGYSYGEPSVSSSVDWDNVIDQFASTYKKGHLVLKNGAGALQDMELGLLERALDNGISVSITTEGVCVPDKFKSGI